MLIRARLFHLPELDAQLVRMISAGRSNLATDLAIHLVRTCLVGDPVVTAADLFNTLDTLAKIARHSSNGPAVLMLVEQARQVTRSASSPPLVLLFAAFWWLCMLIHILVSIACNMHAFEIKSMAMLVDTITTACCYLWMVTFATIVLLVYMLLSYVLRPFEHRLVIQHLCTCRLRPSLKDQTDPPGLRERVVVLFDEWARLSEDQPANQMHDKFVLKLQTDGFLKVCLPFKHASFLQE